MTASPTTLRRSYNTAANSHSEAWAFVLERSNQIDRLAGRFFRLLGTEDRKDAHADYIARIVEQFPKLRLADAVSREMVIVTWLGWQARAVQQTYCRRFRRHEAKRDTDVMLVSILVEKGEHAREIAATEGPGTAEAMEGTVADTDAQDLVDELYASATPRQREAMVATLLDLTPVEVRERYNMSMHDCAKQIEQFATTPRRSISLFN